MCSSDLSTFSFNASCDSKAKLKEIIDSAKFYDNIICIIDEIHRMKKDVQDFLLPFLESGNILAIISAIEVFPHPAGPYNIIEKSLFCSSIFVMIPFYHTDILLKILYGNNIAILTVKKLAPIYLLLYFNPLLVAILQANNKEKAIFVIQIITDTLMLLLAFIFTLFFKTDGLLYGIAIYLIIRFIILLIITIKNSNITIDIIEVLSIILLSIIFILAINLTNPQYHFSLALLYLAISLLLYPNDNNKVFLYLYRKHKVSY